MEGASGAGTVEPIRRPEEWDSIAVSAFTLTAARFGISVAGSTIYSTLSPCFNCLKEAIQAGVVRLVYLKEYAANYGPELQEQYDDLAERLRGSDQHNFEQLVGSPAALDPVGQYPDAAGTEKSA